MMDFVSSRGGHRATFAQALSEGLAPDGGLYLPADVPRLPTPPPSPGRLLDTASWVGRHLFGAESQPWLEPVLSKALDFETPLRQAGEGRWLLELFHGPTLAFKDVGARFMAAAMAALLPTERLRTVLVATSGDTGSAVGRAFLDAPGTQVVILFPEDGIADRQRRQMTTLGGNVVAASVGGTFDDCQRMAKEAFSRPDLRERFGLTSANSINVGRLIPQMFYYIHAARLLGWGAHDALATNGAAPPAVGDRGLLGPAPTFVVPSGNLGNLCAGLLAFRAGMPASGFIGATNANRALVDYLESGAERARTTVSTISNAMDVGAPSNLERLRAMMRSGQDLPLIATSVDDATTLAALRDAYETAGLLLDPHTAVAWAAAARVHDLGRADASRTHAAERADASPCVILATAHPAKFPTAVAEATGTVAPVPERLERALALGERSVSIGPTLSDLRTLLRRLP